MGLALSEGAIASLAERTEGWIAGLQMAGLSLREGRGAEEFVAAFRGEDRYVMDYLMDEVFRRQSEEVQDFLLHASILERLCGPLCDALLEVGGLEPASTSSSLPRGTAQASQEILEHLEHANLFILPLDNRREWYRLHSLFADLLRSRLQRLHPERVPELHRRACHWHVQAGNPDEAMKHALAAADPELAADIAEQFLLQMTGGSRLSTYLVWLRNLPEEVICRRAYLCAGCGWAYVLTHQVDLAERYVQCGETALPHFEPIYSIPDRLWISGEQVRGSLPAIRSYSDRLRGNLPRAIKHAHEALEALPPEALAVRCAVALNLGMLQFDIGDLEMARRAFDEAFETAEKSRGNVYVAVNALSMLGGILVAQGKLREAEAILHRAVRFGTEESKAAVPLPGVGVIHGWLVEIHSQRNEIAAAQEHLDIVLRSVGPMGIPDTTIRAYLYQALLAQSRGEFGVAEEWFQRAEPLIERGPVEDLVRTEWIAFRGQFHLAQGDWASASKLLAAQGVQATDLEEQPAPGSAQARSLGLRLARYLVLARVLLARGALDQAARLLERVCSLAEDCPDFAAWLEALALQAVVAARSRGDAGRALPVLERALDLAAPEGYVRPFLNAGEPLMALLRKAITLGIQPAFAHTLYGELARQERQRVGARAGRVPGGSEAGAADLMPEPLTEREQQILRLLAAGLSSTEIAEELVIAVNTARSYIKSIYGKLDAHSRDEAIEKGKQAGLI
jgi:LuxR family maltose regulon positive regulatory protein